MDWIVGLLLYGVIWWTGLFAVLPFFGRPVAAPDERSGWRGAPEQVRIWRIVLANSLLALVLWVLCYLVITSGWASFRHGILAMHGNVDG